MRLNLYNKIKKIYFSQKGFTLLEMILAVAIISIFFSTVALIVPSWYKSYESAININYARQIANSVVNIVEQQLLFADDVEIIEPNGANETQRITGKNKAGKFTIPIENTTNKIDGLVYDDKFFIRNDIEVSFEMDENKTYCSITVKVIRDTETVLIKERTVMLVGKNN